MNDETYSLDMLATIGITSNRLTNVDTWKVLTNIHLSKFFQMTTHDRDLDFRVDHDNNKIIKCHTFSES